MDINVSISRNLFETRQPNLRPSPFGDGWIGAQPKLEERSYDSPRFLCAGGPDWTSDNGARVIEAFQSVRNFRPDARLDIVGSSPSMQMQVRAGDGVTFHGRLHHRNPRHFLLMGELRSQVSCLVAPATGRISGLGFLEAGGYGIGSIGPDCERAATFIGDGGLLCDPNDTEEISRAMTIFCNPAMAREFGLRAWQHSRQYGGDAPLARRARETQLAGLGPMHRRAAGQSFGSGLAAA